MKNQAYQGGKQMLTRTVFVATGLERSPIQAVEPDNNRACAFTAYGYRTPLSGLPLLGFNGERLEAPTGHYLLGNGYRAYNPVLMRFNSPDNLSPFGRGGINAYVYCGADPVNRVDPSGHVRLPRFLNGPQRVVRMGAPRAQEFTHYMEGGFAEAMVARRYPDAQKTQVYDDGFVFQDKGGTRTTVVAHGDRGRVTLDWRQRSGSQLVDFLKANGAITAQTEKIRTLACHSAELGMNSLAATVARHSGLPTKGYDGMPRASLNQVLEFSRKKPGQGALDEFVRANFEVVKKIRNTAVKGDADYGTSNWQHNPVSFLPRQSPAP
jgi:RHS repeat-associated protein